MSCIHALCVGMVVGMTFATALADRSTTSDLAGVIYGETSGLRPVWRDPNRGRDPSNYDPESARQLQLARQWIGQVVLKRSWQGVADVTNLSWRERQMADAVRVWQSCRTAAKNAWVIGAQGQATHYLLRKGGSAQYGGTPRRPGWAKGYTPCRTFGPFRCVGGGDVPAGTNIYIDFFDDIPF